MGAPPSRLLAGKADTWMRMDLSELRFQRRYGKVLAGGRLYGEIVARGTDMRAAPHGLPSIEKMMGLCSASHSSAKVDMEGLDY